VGVEICAVASNEAGKADVEPFRELDGQ
jgi:hypothetical protein